LLFGGYGRDSTGGGELNDLWRYSAGEWTWMSGSNLAGEAGSYGTQGMPAPGNVPGARSDGVSWIDASGNLWLFGGYGFDSTPTAGLLNDLWRYSAGEWTWMSGSSVVGQSGTYGTQGAAAPDNVPGARGDAVSWTDAAGNFWLFSGGLNNATGPNFALNDLWKYSAGEWTWMSGSNLTNQLGTYGGQGTAAPTNVPGARLYAVSWIDGSGNLWLFGGSGFDSIATGELNDLWKFGP